MNIENRWPQFNGNLVEQVAGSVRLRLLYPKYSPEMHVTIRARESMKLSLIRAGDEVLWPALDEYRTYSKEVLIPMLDAIAGKQVADAIARKLRV